jgi:hypothetical protein
MSHLNLNTNYPLIPNSKEYMIENKVVSIHSEDRDYFKWIDSANFEIELPTDYLNVSSVRLGSYSFPANYNTFSIERGNLVMTFKITKVYDPSGNDPENLPKELQKKYDDSIKPFLQMIHTALTNYGTDKNYLMGITQGFYNPQQMATELTNQMNQAVTLVIIEYLNTTSGSFMYDSKSILYKDFIPIFLQLGGYNQFVVAYNQVSQTLWFGNKSSTFTLTNNSKLYELRAELFTAPCSTFLAQMPEYQNWGLPSYLGFFRCPVDSIQNPIPYVYPRFYYGDALQNGDDGYWLTPDLFYNTNKVNYFQAPAKINLMGDAYFYLEIAGFNSIDETIPFSVDNFTTTTNSGSGVHNSALAKIPVESSPVSQFFEFPVNENVKVFNPPAERIRRIRVKIRYHNGQLVDFGKFNFSFTLIFTTLTPQMLTYKKTPA